MTIVPKSKLPALSFCILYLVQWNMLVQHSWVQHFSRNYHDLKSGELLLSGQYWGWAGKLPLHSFQSESPAVQDILKNTNKKKLSHCNRLSTLFKLYSQNYASVFWQRITCALPCIFWLQTFHQICKEFWRWIDLFYLLKECSNTIPNSILRISNLLNIKGS